MDREVVLAARRQAALLSSLGLPRAAAEIEEFCRAESHHETADQAATLSA